MLNAIVKNKIINIKSKLVTHEGFKHEVQLKLIDGWVAEDL